jgi:choline dehydrogenase
MHSGIGDPAVLEPAGVRVAHALPGVGRNLQDHNAVALRIAANAKLTLHGLTRIDRMTVAMAQALLLRTGMAVRFPCEAGAFTRLTSSATAPEVQWHFFLGMSHSRLRIPGWTLLRPDPLEREGFTVGVYVTRPESRGEIRLRSADPREAPAIHPNALAASADLERLVDAVEQARAVAAQQPLAKHSAGELVPGPAVRDRAAIAQWIRNTAGTVYHPVGTCRMGGDADAVVDADLRVRGIAGLRVADASIMPTITRGNTNAPAIMIGEKCADLMLGRVPLSDAHPGSRNPTATLAA